MTERIPISPHHAYIIMGVAEDMKFHIFDMMKRRENYLDHGYSLELVNTLVNTAEKLYMGSLELKISPAGTPDFICRTCIEHPGTVKCETKGENPGHDNEVLKQSNLAVGEIVTSSNFNRLF